jgi:hypothetical protein
VEKYKKSIGPKGLQGEARDRFKADLYTYLNEQLRLITDSLIDQEREDLHIDIVGMKDY